MSKGKEAMVCMGMKKGAVKVSDKGGVYERQNVVYLQEGCSLCKMKERGRMAETSRVCITPSTHAWPGSGHPHPEASCAPFLGLSA